MGNVFVIIILLALIILSVVRTYKNRKKSGDCRGCPYAGTCAKKASGDACADKKDR